MTKKSTRPSSSVIGYLRVSTADQNLEKNKADILQLANNHDLGRVRFVEETVSARISWRERKLAEVLGSLQANEILGRPPGPGKSKLDPYRPEIESLLANGSTQKFIACCYHTTEANLHNWLKKRGLK